VTFKVIDNFLSDKNFEKIQNTVLSNKFVWFYSDCVSKQNDGDFQFSTMLDTENDEIVKLFKEKIQIEKVIRVKINQTHRTKNLLIHKPHVDQHFDSKAMVLYLNTNNGYTYFDDQKVSSKANRAILFDATALHGGTTCTDQKRRVVLNMNYI
jgi:hypothetical protein|tara:strand:+ start:847 stop:1305 length:459 start_codon:yes stop_codon:yes gene_type:complete